MAAKRGARTIPDGWRASVRRSIEEWVEANGHQRKTTRQLAPLLDISQPTLSEIQNEQGPLGLQVLVRLRRSLKRPLDEILGLDVSDPITKEEPSFEAGMPPIPTDRDEIRRILRAELESIRKEEVARLPPRRKAYR